MDKACYLMLKITFKECFKSNSNITEQEAVEYALNNVAKGLEEIIINNNYDYFSRENNIRESLINCRKNKIKSEILKNSVKTYYYYNEEKTKENKEYYSNISILNIGLEKYGVAKTVTILKDINMVNKLCLAFVIERIKYNHKSELDSLTNEKANFLATSIDSYYSKIKEE